MQELKNWLRELAMLRFQWRLKGYSEDLYSCEVETPSLSLIHRQSWHFEIKNCNQIIQWKLFLLPSLVEAALEQPLQQTPRHCCPTCVFTGKGRKTHKLIFSCQHLQSTAVISTVSTFSENRNDHNSARKTHLGHRPFILVIQEITAGALPHKELWAGYSRGEQILKGLTADLRCK